MKASDEHSTGREGTNTSSLTEGTTKTHLSSVEHSVGQLSNMDQQVMAQKKMPLWLLLIRVVAKKD
jgi:hypothetical protein